jgi:hypothetical protein
MEATATCTIIQTIKLILYYQVKKVWFILMAKRNPQLHSFFLYRGARSTCWVYLEKNGHELLVLVWVPWIPRDVLGAVRHGTTRQIVCLLLQQVQFDVGVNVLSSLGCV